MSFLRNKMSGSSSNASKSVSKDKHKEKDEDSERDKHHRSDVGSSSRSIRRPNRKDHGEDYQQSQSKVPQSELMASELFRDESQPSETRYSKHHHHSSTSTHDDRPSRIPTTGDHQLTMYKPAKYEEPEARMGTIKFKTEYTNLRDVEMAERQTRITTLKGEEREKQEKWAEEKLSNYGACPAGYGWWDYDRGIGLDGRKLEGYRCWAGSHLVTHELLAEGRKRFYSLATRPGPLTQPGFPRGRVPPGSFPSNATAGGYNSYFASPMGYPGNQTFQAMQVHDNIADGHLSWAGPFEAPPPEFVDMMQNANRWGRGSSQPRGKPQWYIHKT